MSVLETFTLMLKFLEGVIWSSMAGNARQSRDLLASTPFWPSHYEYVKHDEGGETDILSTFQLMEKQALVPLRCWFPAQC